MATVGVLCFKGGARAGPRVERRELCVELSELKQGEVWRSTHKAVQTQGGEWPPEEFCYLRGLRGLAPWSSKAS